MVIIKRLQYIYGTHQHYYDLSPRHKVLTVTRSRRDPETVTSSAISYMYRMLADEAQIYELKNSVSTKNSVEGWKQEKSLSIPALSA